MFMQFFYYLIMQAGQVSGETAQATGQAGQDGGGNPYSVLILFGALLLIMYLFLIHPQRTRDKRHRAMLSELKKNDRVVTTGGIHGIVMSVKDGAVVLKIDEAKDIKITVSVGSIGQVVPRESRESS